MKPDVGYRTAPPAGNPSWVVYEPTSDLEARRKPSAWSERKRKLTRKLCTDSLGDFVEQGWHVLEESTPLAWGWHLDVLCDHVQAVLEEHLPRPRGGIRSAVMPRTGLPRPKDPVRDLIINVPPGTMKSLILSVFAPAWMWIRRPSWRVLCASGNEAVAIRDSTRCRDLLKSEWYRELFEPDWEFSADSDGKTMFKNTRGGWRAIKTAGQAVVGERGDAIIVDDPNDAQMMRSEPYRKRINEDWWSAAMSNRVNDPKTAIRIVIMQRLHEEDMTGYILEKNKLRKDGGTWERLLIPMEYEPPPAGAEVPSSFLGWVDPRTDLGELLMPHRFPPAFVSAEKREKGSAGYAGQYQQAPAPKEGNKFLRHHWKFWRYDGAPYVQPNRPQGTSGAAAELLPPMAQWDDSVESWDFTFKGKDSNDWVVGVKVVKVGAQRFVLDRWRKHVGFGGAKTGLIELRNRMPRLHTAIVIEDKANGPAIMEDLEKHVPGLIAVTPKDGKEQRASVMEPQVEAGNWYLPDGAEWLDEWISEFAVFPNGKHDDQVDACSQAEARFGQDSELEQAKVLWNYSGG